MEYNQEMLSTKVTIGNVTMTFHEMLLLLNSSTLTLPKMNSNVLIGNVATILAYSLICLVSLIGNSLVVRVCFSAANRTTTNWLIASLAVSDLLMTLLNIPFNVARLLMDEWPFGSFLCFFVPFIQVMAVYVSSFTMAVIAVHRWRSVTCTTRARNTFSNDCCLFATVLITWFASALMAIPHSIFNKVIKVLSFPYPVLRCRVIYPKETDVLSAFSPVITLNSIDIPLVMTLECFATQYLIPLTLVLCVYIKIGRIVALQGKVAGDGIGEWKNVELNFKYENPYYSFEN